MQYWEHETEEPEWNASVINHRPKMSIDGRKKSMLSPLIVRLT